MIAAQTVAFRKGKCRSELLEASSRAERLRYGFDGQRSCMENGRGMKSCKVCGISLEPT